MNIDRLIQGSGIASYNKVEIVILSQWATFAGISLSKANSDTKQHQECAIRLRNEIDNLFAGLNNGVEVVNETVVPRCWISPDGNALPAYTFFRQTWDARLDRYTGLFTGTLPGREDDALGRVIDEAAQNIIPVSERNRSDLIMPGDIVVSGLRRFISEEITQIKQRLEE